MDLVVIFFNLNSLKNLLPKWSVYKNNSISLSLLNLSGKKIRHSATKPPTYLYSMRTAAIATVTSSVTSSSSSSSSLSSLSHSGDSALVCEGESE
jgi:hypothetical protein